MGEYNNGLCHLSLCGVPPDAGCCWQQGMFGMATRVVSMSTLVFLFPLLKKRYGDGVCLMLAVFGRGAGGFIVGLASLGGNCPHCDFFILREFLLVLGATELLAGACKSTVQVQQLPLRSLFF